MEASTNIKSYRDWVVWQKGMALAKMAYTLTARFPESERFWPGQPDAARGCVRAVEHRRRSGAPQGKREFIQFLSHAEGSLAERDTQLLLSG